MHTTSDNTAEFDKVHRLMSPRDSQCLVWEQLVEKKHLGNVEAAPPPILGRSGGVPPGGGGTPQAAREGPGAIQDQEGGDQYGLRCRLPVGIN